ncbi:MAG TPA: DUF1552 domain-containing protein [Chthoniobacteraceae bacterium]|nr:DUF1552 domain-containing protein [Chthoniobacteraceae bacterium]
MGALLALPALEIMSPRRALGGAAPPFPTRLGFLYVPNGVNVERWFPTGEGASYTLSPTLEPLADLRADILCTSGLTHNQGRDLGDGGGEHPRETSSFLTSAHPRKNFGKDLRAGISVDQFAAQHLAVETRLPSLELACERPQPPGMCDAGYSGVYRNSISWRSATTPVPHELNPRQVFLRMFSDLRQDGDARERGRETMLRRSVLDLVQDEARQLNAQLGRDDQAKLDEYLHSVRALELQIQAAEKFPAQPAPAGFAAPAGIPGEPPEHIRLMLDLTALAYQTDTTRVISLMLANGGSDRAFPWLGVSETHHSMSHHERKPERLEGLARVDRFYVEQFAYLVRKLKSVREGEGTLLDHSLLLYGGSLRDGNKHEHHDLPILLAGRGNGAVSPGRYIPFPKETPMANLFLSMLDAVGLREDRFGDSNGRLDGLKI